MRQSQKHVGQEKKAGRERNVFAFHPLSVGRDRIPFLLTDYVCVWEG